MDGAIIIISNNKRQTLTDRADDSFVDCDFLVNPP